VDGWQGHEAGQHVDVRLTAADGYQAQRSYSISSAPRASQLELLVDCVPDGEFSPYLTGEARVGDRFELRGPIGGYFVWTPEYGGPLLLIAGGSGIAPLASILAVRAVAARGLPTQVLYSARTLQEVLFKGRLEDWKRDDPALAVSVTLTRSAPAGWTGYRRRIDAAMLREVAFEASDGPLAFVCGPTAMVEAAADSLVSVGYPAERIRTERSYRRGRFVDQTRVSAEIACRDRSSPTEKLDHLTRQFGEDNEHL
jgi:ferredoxin-NADP reductase